jgi:hypothetical protein
MNRIGTVAAYLCAYSIAAAVVCAGIVVIGVAKIVERFT